MPHESSRVSPVPAGSSPSPWGAILVHHNKTMRTQSASELGSQLSRRAQCRRSSHRVNRSGRVRTSLTILWLLQLVAADAPAIKAPSRVQFSVQVDICDWEPKQACGTTNSTVGVGNSTLLAPGAEHAPIVTAGACDYGALDWVWATNPLSGKPSLHVTFDSHVIEDASHPECFIEWNATTAVHKPTPAAVCYVSDSREGYHLTHYTFAVLAWE